MSAYNHYRARAAEYQQRAENAPNEQDKYSWLALAESWLGPQRLASYWNSRKRDAYQSADHCRIVVSHAH